LLLLELRVLGKGKEDYKVLPRLRCNHGSGGGWMKAVLISIRPEWCAKIASGEKTIEVRKTRPKLETPFKCYIYCTLPRYPHEDFIEADYPKPQFYGGGKVIGEFVCDQIIEDHTFGHDEKFYSAACMSACDAAAYAMQSPMYGWNISNLKIYDVPRELASLTGLRATRFGAAPYDIKRAPQSWCYVEETDNDKT
jgi:predicted transcriptional regulator